MSFWLCLYFFWHSLWNEWLLKKLVFISQNKIDIFGSHFYYQLLKLKEWPNKGLSRVHALFRVFLHVSAATVASRLNIFTVCIYNIYNIYFAHKFQWGVEPYSKTAVPCPVFGWNFTICFRAKIFDDFTQPLKRFNVWNVMEYLILTGTQKYPPHWQNVDSTHGVTSLSSTEPVSPSERCLPKGSPVGRGRDKKSDCWKKRYCNDFKL